MPGQKPTRTDSWAWFKAELERRLGKEQAAALWAELNERRAQERIAKERRRAPRMIAELTERIRAARQAGGATARLEKQLARWRALIAD